ncbi:TetR/AcrR family transcriptional regulator [Pseudorhodobacter sp.]|uniref:TetR/AcrR family transcriptional regulator n=1 Tax=Pseudorhodobacter sp. TaxID=1934400 RepID=UPI00264913E8|nr:TetR/AcrR family transcriptional regulator [Pseudorhodobacter sp.]MDN5787974.1 TetR/AcrR family transcriptional regulator [Pseudorhodobacter sp.]
MNVTSPDPTTPRRRSAGEDPAKREAILQGAAQVFLESGFDAASMNDICRAAGVSKSTLYVYFTSKEDLFERLVAIKGDKLIMGLEGTLRGDGPCAQKLRDFSYALSRILCSDEVIRAQRTVISMAERMPELSDRFYEGGAARAQKVLAGFLEAEVTEGSLTIPDIALATYQLIELATAGLWRPRLFGKITDPPDEGRLRLGCDSAVAMFLRAYSAR